MKYEIRKSDDGTFYYLLKIDADNNETLIAEDKSLAALKNHKDISGKTVNVVAEADVRGTVEPPKPPKKSKKA